jgi:hypothetical protein
MHVKFYPRSEVSARATARTLALFALALAAACGEPEDDEGPGVIQTGNPAQSADAAIAADTGVAINPIVPDAGSVNTFDAGFSRPDASTITPTPTVDSGSVITPAHDASIVDAASSSGDSGLSNDAGAGGDAGGCATYENFGKQFMTTYCIVCHTGATAKHMVQLDTLAGVQKNKVAVKRQAVTTTVMPEANPKPSSAERQKLGQWLDCGPN